MEEAVPTPNKSSKKRLVLILILVLAVLVGAFILVNNYRGKKKSQAPKSDQVVNEEIRLSFVPNTLYAKPSQKVSSDIVFDAGDTPISRVTISVSYDSTKVKNVKVTPHKDPNSALSYSLVALPGVEINSSGGLTTITYKLLSAGTPQKGRGIVAKFEGILVSTPTDMMFGQDSSATSSRSNINLKLGLVNLNILPSTN